jgi:hypothetical protein
VILIRQSPVNGKICGEILQVHEVDMADVAVVVGISSSLPD